MEAMSTAGLPSILGEGDEAAWKKMLEHPNSFLFAVVNAGGDVESLHELMWQRRKPRATPSGALGWVICVQNSATGAPLPKGYCFRVHICRQTPCTAVYPPAKYGDTPAPLRHGHIVKLCDGAEEVNIEASWKLVTAEHSRPECSEELKSKTVESANSFKSPTETAGSVAMIAGDAADTKTGFGCTNSLPSSPVGEAIDSAAPGAAIHAGEPENEQEVAPAVVAIRVRADEISVPGNWIGMLEVMAFCAVHKRRVVLQLQDGTVDVMSSLVPSSKHSCTACLRFLPGTMHFWRRERSCQRTNRLPSCHLRWRRHRTQTTPSPSHLRWRRKKIQPRVSHKTLLTRLHPRGRTSCHATWLQPMKRILS